MEQEDYSRREAGTSGSCIPAAVLAPTGNKHCSGAVSGTDSESESEFQSKIRGNRVKHQFKWTSEYEDMLEDLLIKHSFDFRAASRDFIKEINSEEQENFYTIDVKTLQLRWTDIEIRKYRLTSDKPTDESDTQIDSSSPREAPPAQVPADERRVEIETKAPV